MGIYLTKENKLKALCIAHPTVQHGADVAGKIRKSFFRINNEEELTASLFNNIAFPCVAFISLQGKIKDNGNGLVDLRHSFQNQWWFLTKVTFSENDGEGYTERISQAYDAMFDIMEDFIKSMKDEFMEQGSCGLFENFDIERLNYVQIGPVVEHEYGWCLYFEDEVTADRLI